MSFYHGVVSQPFSTTWKKALVSLPRLVPDSALHLTSPEGPHPFVLKIPARDPGKHHIPVYVFVYVPPKGVQRTSKASSKSARTPNSDTEATEKQLPRGEEYKASAPAFSTKAGAARDEGSFVPTASAASATSDVSTASTKEESTFVATTSYGTAAHTLNLPVLIDFHGGSFILGTPQEQAPFCARMARELGSACSGGGCVVISVDYRLGPYAQYPAANEDAEDVVRAVLEESSQAGNILRDAVRHEVHKLGRDEWVNIDKTRIALSGFSSGGNLALTLAMSVKNDPTLRRHWPSVFPACFPRPIPILLFYPSLDSRLLPDERPRPRGLDPPAGFFTRLKIESELMPKYLPIEKRAHPRASPGLGEIKDGGLHAQARAMLILPELDSLSEQSMDWVKKVEVEGREEDLVTQQVPGVMHGWTQFPDSWLKSDEERQKKVMVFTRAREFVQEIWEN